jgi:hypothetical protein
MSFKRRNLMKIFLLLVGVAVFAGSTLADEVPYSDPRIGLGKGTGSTPTYGTFTFFSNENGGGVSDVFFNATETTYFNLLITTKDPGGTINCDIYAPDYFSNCSFTRQNGMIAFLFSNPTGEGEGDGGDPSGIGPCTDFGCPEFQFTLNDAYDSFDPNGSGGWGSYHSFSGVANTPEPGTLTLLATLLGLQAAKGKFRRRRSSRP